MTNTLTIRSDRLEEIEDFIDALNEWGCDDEEDRQQQIAEFLQSPIGLTQYLDRSATPIIGNA